MNFAFHTSIPFFALFCKLIYIFMYKHINTTPNALQCFQMRCIPIRLDMPYF